MDIKARFITRLSYEQRKQVTEEIWEKLDILANAIWYINKSEKGTSEVLNACTDVQKLLNNIITDTLDIIEKEIREEIRGE